MTMGRDELSDLTMQAIAATLDRNAEEAARALSEIGTRGNSRGIYAACCAFAHLGKVALTKLYGDQAPDLKRGDMWAMDILQPGADPHDLFAVRFIVAYANEDRDQVNALFDASIAAGPEDHVCSVTQLLITAVQLTNTAKDQ
ncbi:hypothetical protein V2W30_22530 [Streptomyces sp. Q6]|uniref:Uncharacterized protein n=1 Tax=Streptomyces citrinus TaxID=3118173 RepID=A0ACD5AEZ3_9ACTN